MVFPDILDLIPHRAPMILIDRLVSVDNLTCVSEYKVPKNGIFTNIQSDDALSYLSEMGLIEHVAQTSMAFIQLFFKRENHSINGQDFFGYISNIQQVEIKGKAYSGQTIQTKTHTELVFSSENLKICNIEATVLVEENCILNANMKMLLQAKA